jgi:hypothetical protein
MAFETNVFDFPMEASANVSAVTYTGNPPVYSSGGIPQFSAVMVDTTTGNVNDVILATTGKLILGIAQDGPATGPGQSIRLRQLGISKAIASGAVSYGDMVYVANSSGQLGTAPAAGATDSFCVGIALTAATAVGDTFSVLLVPGLATNVNA